MDLVFCSRKRLLTTVFLLVSVPWVVGQGCLIGGFAAAPTVTVSGPATNETVSAGEIVSVIYTAQSSATLTVSAFYDVDGIPGTGDEVVFASGLPSGTNRTASWNTGEVTPGTYSVGVVASDGTSVGTGYAPGRVTVEAGIGVTFATPSDDILTNAGAVLTIRFATTLSASYSYTLFYDQDGVADGDEINIGMGTATGSSVVSVDWNTTGLAPGTYFVGVTVTDASVSRTATAYAAGQVEIIAGAFVYVIQPANNIEVRPGDLTEIVFTAGVPNDGTGSLELFYDLDQQVNGNEVTIESGIALDRRNLIWNTTGVPADTYFIGASLRLSSGGSPIATAYASGRIQIEGEPSGGAPDQIVVTTPLNDQTIFQGNTYVIRWSTGATQADGTVSLLYDNDPDDSTPGTLIVSGLNPALRQYSWNTSGVTGRFFIIGQLTLNDGTVAEDASTGALTIRPPFAWIGDLGTSVLPGATFQGVNFQDHAGSTLLPAGDQDVDAYDDFIIVAQYGKPNLENPSGVGAGEAYLIFGDTTRLSGAYSLNSVGTEPAFTGFGQGPESTLPVGIGQGVVFRGVRPPTNSFDTSGITAAVAIPDIDEDGVPELVFGMSKVDSTSLANQNPDLSGLGSLEASDQFNRGGLVIVSSWNQVLWIRSATNRIGDRIIPLQEIGQVFDRMVSECPGEGTFDAVLAGADTFYGTYDVDNDECTISQPDEPYGARIIGQEIDDEFATSISFLDSNTGDDVIFASAPNHQALQAEIPQLAADRLDAGVVYQLRLAPFWNLVTGYTPPENENDPPIPVYLVSNPGLLPRPYQYVMFDVGSSIPTTSAGTAGYNISRPIHVVGEVGDHLSVVQGMPDVNLDTIPDFAVGAPNKGGGGAAYIFFRRLAGLEGNLLIDKVALSPTDPERVTGVMINGEAGDDLGEVLAPGGDFNGDGHPDVIIGIPNHNGGAGAVLIVFARADLLSPGGGYEIDDMVTAGLATLLTGVNTGDAAGFNVANAGDVDGDGTDDLLIAAPGAGGPESFDLDNDGTDDFSGLDLDGDGLPDDLDGDGAIDDLTGAGQVYLVFGANDLLGELSLSRIGSDDLRGIAFVGRKANFALGGGLNSTLGVGVRSKGIAAAGDVDGDGRGDILISSALANPGGRPNAGEAYLVYGGLAFE
jgi:hypothetical protein